MATAKKVTEKKVVVKKTAPVKKSVAVKKEASVKKTVAPAKVVEPKVERKQGTLTIDVLNELGKADGTVKLPVEIFGAEVVPSLIAQAVRVYLINQRRGTVSTLTRGEVDGSTRKIYRQKGTGRARHGGVRAPIFVKGGIAHGPKPVDYNASLSKNMRKAALFSALSSKLKDNGIKVVTGVEKEVKTKNFAKAFGNWGIQIKGRNVLFVMPKYEQDLFKGVRNLKGVSVTSSERLNTYEVLQHKTVIFLKDAIEATEKMFSKEK